jgi:hypothetical protein
MIKTTGGNNMSAARTLFIIISLLAMMVITVYVGCSPDRTGTAAENQPPQVFITNTPPDSAHFSRNPDLTWYGTDIDGYITFFRYAVVVESLLVIDGDPVTPEEFVAQATDEQFGWDTLPVDLDNPQSTATVRLYANVDFPVDSVVIQYFFIQARDDRQAMSQIKWRMYTRNNNFPNTHHRATDFYINAIDPLSPAPGISLIWDGADSTDWGRAQPPLEYEWRLYGPFERDDIIRVNLVQENCIYDPTTDSFINCLDIPVLDLENLPQAVQNVPQPLRHSEGPNFANDTSDVWVTETEVTLYDVFRELNLQETSKYKFVFWVRARDDGFVPDPTPPFSQFWVYEAKFEKSVMVVDETGYTTRVGRWAPVDMDTVKAYFQNAIHAAGYTDFDTTYSITEPMHYFYSASKKNTDNDDLPTDVRPDDTTLRVSHPSLLDVLSHRVIIHFNDDSESGPKEGNFGLLDVVFDGLAMGASGLMMSRKMGGEGQWNDEPRSETFKSPAFSYYFGIQIVVIEGWLYGVFNPQNPGIYNEEFVGGYANIDGFPDLPVGYGEGSLLDIRYPRIRPDTSHAMQGMPEIGVGTRTQFAAPLYLYLSRRGEESYFHGKVNAVIQQIGDLRSACFMFTPLSVDPEPMQYVFDILLPWLSEKFESSAKSSSINIPSYNPGFASIAERRARIERHLRYMSTEATDEERARFGMTRVPPVQVNPR